MHYYIYIFIYLFIINFISPPLVEVNSSSEVKELQKSHPVLFCLVHDHEIHEDWQVSLYIYIYVYVYIY